MHHINRPLPSKALVSIFSRLEWSTLYVAKQTCTQWYSLITGLAPTPDQRLPADKLLMQSLANGDIYCLAWFLRRNKRTSQCHESMENLISSRLHKDLTLEQLELLIMLLGTTFKGADFNLWPTMQKILFRHPEWARVPHNHLIAKQIEPHLLFAALGDRRIQDAKQLFHRACHPRFIIPYVVKIGSLELIRYIREQSELALDRFILKSAIKYSNHEIADYILDPKTPRGPCGGAFVMVDQEYYTRVAAKLGRLDFLSKFTKDELSANATFIALSSAAQHRRVEDFDKIIALSRPGRSWQIQQICLGAMRGNHMDLLLKYIGECDYDNRWGWIVQKSFKYLDIGNLQLVINLTRGSVPEVVPSSIARAADHICDRIKILVENRFSVTWPLVGSIERELIHDILPSQRLDLRRAKVYVESLLRP
jgi:hypothetical protein